MRFHKIRLISGEINPTQTSKLQDFALYLIWRNKPIVLRLFDLISLRAPQPMVGVHQVQTAERRCWERQVDKMWEECPWNRLRDFESTVIHWNWVKIIGIYHQSKGGGDMMLCSEQIQHVINKRFPFLYFSYHFITGERQKCFYYQMFGCTSSVWSQH